MSPRAAAALAAGILLVLPIAALPATIHVPADQPTIQAGIDAAAAGDTVLVACGTYFETDLILKSDIHLFGEQADPICVTVDADGNGGCFSATDVTGSTVRGVDFRNGRPPSPGYATIITRSSMAFESCGLSEAQSPTGYGYANCLVTDSSPTFQDCDFLDNRGRAVTVVNSTAEFRGCTFAGGSAYGWEGTAGALVETGSTVHFEDCVFSLNSLTGGWYSYGYAGAIAMRGSSTSVTGQNCLFEDNDGNRGDAGAVSASEGSMTLDDCVFTGNVGWLGADAVWVHDAASVSLDRCRFVENDGVNLIGVRSASSLALMRSTLDNHLYSESTAILMLGGNAHVSDCTLTRGRTFVDASYGATVTIDRSILAFATFGNAVDVSGPSTVTLSCSDLFGNGGDWVGPIADQANINGNFSADPLFCDFPESDFTIQSDSPCAPPGVTGCGLVGALPVGCGPVSVERESWAGIKARYRGGRK